MTTTVSLLVLDLDGTTIGPDETVTPGVFEAVCRVAERIPVSIATGRERGDVIRYAGQLGLTAPQISDNGALILDPTSGDGLWSAPLGEVLAREAVQPIIDSGCEFIATHAGGIVTDVAELNTWDLTRVSALDLQRHDAEQMVERMIGSPGLDVVKVWLPYNNLWAVDFTRKGIDKGAGLRALCDILEVDVSTSVAVGDSYNDIPLLSAAGVGVAMGGAPPEVRAVADHVVGPVSGDGLVEAIECYVLPRLAQTPGQSHISDTQL